MVFPPVHFYQSNRFRVWDILTRNFTQNFSVSAKETNATGLFFKNDGSKMYVCGQDSAAVHEYDLSTNWDISTAVFLQSFDLSAQTANSLAELFFRADGLKMYTDDAKGKMYEYDLSTAWNVSTLSFVANLNFASRDGNPRGIHFKEDGLKMYFAGEASDFVYEFDLSPAWDITSGVFLQRFDVKPPVTNPSGLWFRDNGSRMYVNNLFNNHIYQFDLSTAWDISTSTLDVGISAQDSSIQGIYIRSGGDRMYIIGRGNDDVYQYSLG